jgi:prepilin-type N-terminal cleavage/methylation domain-containing protein
MSRASDRPVSRGATLLELIVSLAVLGASASIGRSISKGWLVSVIQTGPALFDVVVADTLTKAPVLRTTLYRPDTSDAENR